MKKIKMSRKSRKQLKKTAKVLSRVETGASIILLAVDLAELTTMAAKAAKKALKKAQEKRQQKELSREEAEIEA
jgi:hypothetical protein